MSCGSTVSATNIAGTVCVREPSDGSKNSGHCTVHAVGSLPNSDDTTTFKEKVETAEVGNDVTQITIDNHNTGTTIDIDWHKQATDMRIQANDKSGNASTKQTEEVDQGPNVAHTTSDLGVCGLKDQTCQSLGTCGSTVKLQKVGVEGVQTTENLTTLNPKEGTLASEHPTVLYGVCKGSVDIVTKIVDVGHSI